MRIVCLALLAWAAGDDPPTEELAVEPPAEAPPAEAADEMLAEPEPEPWPQRWKGQVQPSDPHYELELMYAEGRFDEGLIEARRLIGESPDDPDLYWHAARFMFEQGERFQRDDPSIDKEAHYTEMVALAERGLEADPDNAHNLFALGIAKGRLGTTRGVLSSLFMARDIERAWLASVASGHRYASLNGQEHLPCDTYLALSIYYRLVPDWWVVQLIAGTRGSQEKSVEYARLADRCAPGRIRNLKELGVSLICAGQREDAPELVAEGVQALERIGGIAPSFATERIDREHAAMLIAQPELACEYSRDGQQDLDRAKLEE